MDPFLNLSLFESGSADDDVDNDAARTCPQPQRRPDLPHFAEQTKFLSSPAGDRQNRMEVVLVVVALQQHISTCCSCKP